MAQPRKPKYRKHSQRDFGFVEVRGQRIRFPGKYGSSESLEAYHVLCAKLAREARLIEPPKPLEPSGLSVYELIIGYLDFLESRDPPPSTVELTNEKLALRYLGKKFGDTHAEEFGPIKLAALRDEMANTVRKNRHGEPVASGRLLSREFVNITMFRIRRLFTWAVSRELVNPTIPMALKTVTALRFGRSKATEPRKKTPVTPRQLAAVMRSVNPIVRDMLRVHWYLGVRGKSLCLATPEQFDTSGPLWIWKPRHKTEWRGHDLTVFVGPRCQKVLKPYLKRTKPGHFLFTPRDVARASPRFRNRYYPATYAQAVKAALERVNRDLEPSSPRYVTPWTPHQIRHSKGHTVRARFGIEAAQATLGHKSLSSTEVYSERRSALAKLVAEQTG